MFSKLTKIALAAGMAMTLAVAAPAADALAKGAGGGHEGGRTVSAGHGGDGLRGFGSGGSRDAAGAREDHSFGGRAGGDYGNLGDGQTGQAIGAALGIARALGLPGF